MEHQVTNPSAGAATTRLDEIAFSRSRITDSASLKWYLLTLLSALRMVGNTAHTRDKDVVSLRPFFVFCSCLLPCWLQSEWLHRPTICAESNIDRSTRLSHLPGAHEIGDRPAWCSVRQPAGPNSFTGSRYRRQDSRLMHPLGQPRISRIKGANVGEQKAPHLY